MSLSSSLSSSSSTPTINFFINYNQPLQGKKITVPKSISINQLILQALTVYKIDSNNYEGQLYHNGKLLDGSLPIRLTNLLNNSKLNLKTIAKLNINNTATNTNTNTTSTTTTSTTNQHEINVKFINDNTGSIKVEKCFSGLNLIELIKKFNGGCGDDDDDDNSTKKSELRIVNVIIESEKYHETTLESIVGKSNNVVIRFKYKKIDNDNDNDNDRIVKQRQEEAIKLHIKQENIRKKVQEQEKLEQRLKEQEQEKQKEKEKEKQNVRVVEDDIIEEDPKENQPQPQPQPQEFSSLNDIQILEPKQEKSAYPTIVQPQQQYTFQLEEKEEEEINDTPQLYIPSIKKQEAEEKELYENPDEDYELTLNQLKTYQNIIRDSGKKKNHIDQAIISSPPNKYQIRIKFPDLKILQINFIKNIEKIKFNDLIKKIDELLLPKFINNYNLKFGYPPFKTIDILSYNNNNNNNKNEYLYNLPDFQQEKIMLIWELQKSNLNLKGPYIKNEGLNLNSNSNSNLNLNIKPTEELPERILERHRGELPNEIEENEKSITLSRRNTSNNNNNNDDDYKSIKKSKVPKWFKMK